MPATNGINLATVEIDLITEINNSNGATMLMNPSTLVTTSNLIAELEKIAGLEFGGNIQDIGNKTKGKFYYDNVTKFYYECIENTNLTYNESSKFRAISNKPLSDKMVKLCEVKTHTFSHPNLTYAVITKVGNIATLSVDSKSFFSGKSNAETLLQMPEGFRPVSVVNISAISLEKGITNFILHPDGNLKFKLDERPVGAFLFTVSYVCG